MVRKMKKSLNCCENCEALIIAIHEEEENSLHVTRYVLVKYEIEREREEKIKHEIKSEMSI